MFWLDVVTVVVGVLTITMLPALIYAMSRLEYALRMHARAMRGFCAIFAPRPGESLPATAARAEREARDFAQKRPS